MTGLVLNYKPQVFADTSEMSHDEWLKTRRFGIGGSEASIVMGVSPFATKRDLYYDKIGTKPVQVEPEEENWVAKAVGNRLEELVAMIFSKKTGLNVYPDKRMYQHPLFPFMKADLDFIIEFEDGTEFWNVRHAIIIASLNGKMAKFRLIMSGSAGIIWQ